MQVNDNLLSSDTEPNRYTTVDELYKELAVEDALDGFIKHIEILAEKENELNEKMRNQHLVINSLTNENKMLQEENERFRFIIENFLVNYKGLNDDMKNGRVDGKAKEMVEFEEIINKKNEEKATIESENIDLYRKNMSLEKENKELKENMEHLTKSFERINNFILSSFNKKETKKLTEHKEPKAKPSTKTNSKKSSQTEINTKRSPITTRNRRGTKKVHNEVVDSVQAWNEGEGEEDYEAIDESADFEEEEEVESDDYDTTPRKGRKKKAAGEGSGKKSAPAGGMNKRAMNRDIHAANRNTILHQLFH